MKCRSLFSGDNLHEVLKLIFRDNKKNIINLLCTEFFPKNVIGK